MTLLPPEPGPAPEPILLTVGDIGVSQHYVVLPHGAFPIRGSNWIVQDNRYYTESISTAGAILAVIFIGFCLLGLLFLLMKERKLTGTVTVSVAGQGYYHATQLRADQMAWAQECVNYCRSLAAA